MKKLIVFLFAQALIFSSIHSQELTLDYAQKFDFNDVQYEEKQEYLAGMLLVNHTADLSSLDIGFDPMGSAGSVFFLEEDDLYYSGSFVASTGASVLDVNYNELNEHQTILLDVQESCIFDSFEEIDLNFAFPELENMTGLIHFSDQLELDTFWTSYLIASDNSIQRLWSAGALTLVSGSFSDSMMYVDPDGTEFPIMGNADYNGYVIALDEFGFYQWSYVSDAIGLNFVRDIEENNNTINIAHDIVFATRLIYLDFEGNSVKEPDYLDGIGVNDLGFTTDNEMLMCGNYSSLGANTNLDLNGGQYFLPEQESFDAFLIKYSAEGNVDWGQVIKGGNIDTGVSLDISEEGNVYMTGCIQADALFDGSGANSTSFNSVGFEDAFIAKYAMDGSMEWATTFGGNGADIGLVIHENEWEELVVFGLFGETMDVSFDGEEEVSLTNENPDIERSYFYIELEENEVLSTSEDRQLQNVYPNPASSFIKTLNAEEKITRLRSIDGNTLQQYNANQIDISSIPNGLYIIETVQNRKVMSQLISILH